MVTLWGIRMIETKARAGTVIVEEPLIPAAVAVIVTVPCAALVAKSASLASLLTTHTLGVEELHTTDDKI